MEVHPDNEGLSAFSSIDIVSQCLVDIERTEAFRKAIMSVVKTGDTVLDLGTGSSILSLFASQAGAKKVIGVEFDPFIGKSAFDIVRTSNLEDTIEIRITDARNCIFSTGTKFDVVIAELITTGLIDEHQVAAINNLHKKGVVDKNTKYIPACQKTFVTLGNFNFVTFGFNIPFVRHLWRFHHKDMRKFDSLTARILISTFNFLKPVSEEFKFSQSIKVEKNGLINAVYLSGVTELCPGLSIEDTDALNGPVVVPVEPINVSAGQDIWFDMNYLFGGGFESVKISLTI